MNTAAAVILNYNDAGATIAAVKRLLPFKCISHVLAVDNASTDGSPEKIEAAFSGVSKVTVLKNGKNGGYGYGNNRGVRFCFGKLGAQRVVIANPDAFFDEETVLKMLSVLDACENAAAIGAVMELSGGNKISYDEYKMSGWMERGFFKELLASVPFVNRAAGRFINYSYNYYKYGQAGKVAPLGKPMGEASALKIEGKGLEEPLAVRVYAVHGSFLTVDAAKFLTSGGYDESMFLYMEEYALAARLKAAGYGTYLLKRRYRHSGSHSITGSGLGAVERQKMRAASELIYYRDYLKAGKVRLFAARMVQGLVLVGTRLFLR